LNPKSENSNPVEQVYAKFDAYAKEKALKSDSDTWDTSSPEEALTDDFF
jgi:hypothetical protein